MTEKPAVPVEPLSELAALREAIIDRHNLSTSSHNAALWNDCMDPICSGLAEFQLATLDAARERPGESIDCPLCHGFGYLVDVTTAIEDAQNRGHRLVAIPTAAEPDWHEIHFPVADQPESAPVEDR
jgi:hypothetical protein